MKLHYLIFYLTFHWKLADRMKRRVPTKTFYFFSFISVSWLSLILCKIVTRVNCYYSICFTGQRIHRPASSVIFQTPHPDTLRKASSYRLSTSALGKVKYSHVCVTAAGSLSPETSTIPVNCYRVTSKLRYQWTSPVGYTRESYGSYLMLTEYYFL